MDNEVKDLKSKGKPSLTTIIEQSSIHPVFTHGQMMAFSGLSKATTSKMLSLLLNETKLIQAIGEAEHGLLYANTQILETVNRVDRLKY